MLYHFKNSLKDSDFKNVFQLCFLFIALVMSLKIKSKQKKDFIKKVCGNYKTSWCILSLCFASISLLKFCL